MSNDIQLTPMEQLTMLPEYSNYVANMMGEQIRKNLSVPTMDYKNIPSPAENFKFLTDRIDSMKSELEIQTNELQKVRYENIKLNAQIEVLNKTIDSNEEKLNELQITNANLKTVNETLKNSNKHYWRNTFIISFVVAFIFFMLGLIF